MKYTKYGLLIVLMVTFTCSITYADVYKLEAIVKVEVKADNQALQRYANLAGNIAGKTSSGDDITAAINANLILKNGYQYSFPVVYFVDLDSNGCVLRYRVDAIEPVLDMYDPSFTRENPAIKVNKFSSTIGDYALQEKVIINKDLNEKVTGIEYGQKIYQIGPTETWLTTFNQYQKIKKDNPAPKTIVGQTELYEIPVKQDKTIKMEKSSDGKKVQFYVNELSDKKEYYVMEFENHPIIPETIIDNNDQRKITVSFENTEIIDDTSTEPFAVPESQ